MWGVFKVGRWVEIEVLVVTHPTSPIEQLPAVKLYFDYLLCLVLLISRNLNLA
jgi:hypothetical protein